MHVIASHIHVIYRIYTRNIPQHWGHATWPWKLPAGVSSPKKGSEKTLLEYFLSEKAFKLHRKIVEVDKRCGFYGIGDRMSDEAPA